MFDLFGWFLSLKGVKLPMTIHKIQEFTLYYFWEDDHGDIIHPYPKLGDVENRLSLFPGATPSFIISDWNLGFFS